MLTGSAEVVCVHLVLIGLVFVLSILLLIGVCADLPSFVVLKFRCNGTSAGSCDSDKILSVLY